MEEYSYVLELQILLMKLIIIIMFLMILVMNLMDLQSSFDLKAGGSNTTGIATENAVILINDVFQGPVKELYIK